MRTFTLLLLPALVSLACGSRSAPPERPLSTREQVPAPRLSTVEEDSRDADFVWSSTYGNPRPKLTETLSLGTSDVPSPAPSAPALVSATDQSSTHPTRSTNVTQQVVVVVAPTAYDLQSRRAHSAHQPGALKERAPLPANGAPQPAKVAQNPPKNPGSAPAPGKPVLPAPVDAGNSETKRTSVVAPTTPHKR